MKRTCAFIFSALILAAASSAVYAGDSAAFEDMGFSADGKTYVFGQYGKTDKKFQAWAESFTVDVAGNVFVKNEVYKTEPSKKTAEISGKRAFDDLRQKTQWKFAGYSLKPNTASNLIYLRENEKKNAEEEITFQCFDESTEEKAVFYSIRLIPEFEGSGKNVKSKFYLLVKKTSSDGTVLGTWKVGTPELKRKGISSYTVDKIFMSDDLKSLVIVVQKTLEDDTGTSIRYMVETLRF